MIKKELYAVLLGGKIRKDNLMEDHHLTFVVAKDEAEARKLAKKKWNAEEIHVDGTQKLSTVDGYKVVLRETGGEGDNFELNPNYSL